jgi:hypothetical protein
VRAARVVDTILRSYSQDETAQEEKKKDEEKETSSMAKFCSFISSSEAEFSHGAFVLAAALLPVDGDTYSLPNKSRVDSLVKYIASDRLHLEQSRSLQGCQTKIFQYLLR